MVIAVSSSDDVRLSKFIRGRFHETFLLNTLQNIPIDLRLADIENINSVKATASINAGTLTVQMPGQFNGNLLSEAFRQSTNLSAVVRLICEDRHAIDSETFLKNIGYAATLEDVATFFEIDIAKIATNPFIGKNITARLANPNDEETLMAWYLSTAINPTQEDINDIRELVAQRCAGTKEFWVLENNGHPVSFGGISERAENSIKIAGVLTQKQHRGEGYAPQLISHFLSVEKTQNTSRTAVLLALTDTAKKCYDRMGFERIGNYATLRLTPLR